MLNQILGALTIFAYVAIAIVLVAVVVHVVYADHVSEVDDIYVYHNTGKWFNERHEIHLIEVWVQKERHYEPFRDKCHPDYMLTPDGRCTLNKYHYWVYSLYLITEMPSACDNRAVGCIVENGIYIINGKERNIPSIAGCSILWHEILHLKWSASTPVEDHHDRMEREFPNSKCAINQHG